MEQRREEQTLYRHTSREGEESIETRLDRDAAGRLHLFCRLSGPDGGDETVLPDLGRPEKECLAFARAVAESHTHPRILAELWEEYEG